MSANHEDFALLADGYVLGTLSELEARRFDAHLATCEECQRHVRDVAAVTEAMARALPQATPSADLRAKVLARAASPAIPASPASPSSPSSPSSLASPASPSSPSSAAWQWLAVAASLTAVIAGGLAWQYREEAKHARAALQAGTDRVQSLEQQVARLQTDARTAAQTRSVLAASDMARVDLAGQSQLPAAAGRVFWSPTHGLVFAATNLPALPPGRVYQLWVVADAPIPAGLGAPTSGGELSVVSSPASPARPKAFAVTVEPEGGSPAPTTPILLLGSY